MMTKFSKLRRLSALLLTLATLLGLLAACGSGDPAETTGSGNSAPVEHIDYVGSLTLDMSSPTAKQEVTVKTFIDGDTTHFNFPGGNFPNGVLKARYLAVNTPESTGKIEEWGKAAANFTKEALKSATSIIVESESAGWDADSTGDRYLVWVWYRTSDSAPYRNLNVELLQNGLAIASNSANNQYGDTCMNAITQAKAEKLKVYSGESDPDYFYGDATELTLKELRCNLTTYNNTKVAFEGVITKNAGESVYVEDYDPETGLYYGMYVYYGYNLSSAGLKILSVGNRVQIVGSVQYYEAGDSYQVSDISYNVRHPDDPNNIKLISEGNSGAYTETTAETFNSQVTLTVGEEQKTFPYAELALGTSVSMKGLTVKSVYTTTSETDSDGAMTLTCEDAAGNRISVRTVVLRDADGNKITESYFNGKTIDVKGIVDCFSGTYQVKLFSINDVAVS
ncbi:MAG: thermonuclease family protein [Clostridia bacterium]|nr:thermonuclease family protein [Clostridia bacterium]